MYPHIACNTKRTLVLAEGVTGENVLSFYAASKRKRPNFEVLVAKSSDMNKKPSFIKVLGQKRMMPNADNATLVSSESQLHERYNEFASGRRNRT